MLRSYYYLWYIKFNPNGIVVNFSNELIQTCSTHIGVAADFGYDLLQTSNHSVIVIKKWE
ncbi:MAG: hypothetical protein M1419_07180 [Bacteroidetes bacterium]|nr:hypothetical protein [Bacteroidota bacterium]